MSQKHSIASKKRWAAIPKQERSKMMAKLVTKRHKSMTPDAKKKLGAFLMKTRVAKGV